MNIAVVTTSPHPYDIEAGKTLRRVRLAADLTQVKLAKKVGLSFQQLQKYETGYNRLSVSRLRELAEIIGVKPSIFFGDVKGTIAELSDDEFAMLRAYRKSESVLQSAAMNILTTNTGVD